MNDYNTPTFTEDSTLEDIRKEFDRRIATKGKVKAKIGITSLAKMAKRYPLYDRYMQLNSSMIFAYCKYSVAIKIEPIIMQWMKEMNICMNSYHESVEPNVRALDDCDACIYMTPLKENLYCCPIAKCTYVSELEFVKTHLTSHDYYNSTKMALNKLKLLGIEIPPWVLSSIDPKSIPYCHRAWKATDCENCGLECENGQKLAAHRSTCKQSKRTGFPCLVAGCTQKSASLNDLAKHQRMHAKSEELKKRSGIYKCHVCGKKFDHNGAFHRHVRTHDTSNKLSCPRCGNLFSRKDGVDRHMKNYAPGSRQCPLPKRDV